jgi:hypothetical protein
MNPIRHCALAVVQTHTKREGKSNQTHLLFSVRTGRDRVTRASKSIWWKAARRDLFDFFPSLNFIPFMGSFFIVCLLGASTANSRGLGIVNDEMVYRGNQPIDRRLFLFRFYCVMQNDCANAALPKWRVDFVLCGWHLLKSNTIFMFYFSFSRFYPRSVRLINNNTVAFRVKRA